MTSEWLREGVHQLNPIGVDMDRKVISGYVVALRGPFKTPGRGQFTERSLQEIVRLMRLAEPMGLKSRFTHPTMSDDGLGSFLGRARNPRLIDGAVRADLHLAEAAFASPRGDLGSYVLSLAASDPGALSSSLVLLVNKVPREENGKPLLDAEGQPQPPEWLPTKLHATDLVDEGDATDGLLSAEGGDQISLGLWRGAALLDRIFAGKDRDFLRQRATAWLDRYLESRFGEGTTREEVTRRRRRLRLQELGGG